MSVVVKGVANAGTITDMDGKFTLKLPYAEAPLVFSYLGYQPQEIVPGAKKELDCLTTGRYESLAGSGCGRLYQTT